MSRFLKALALLKQRRHARVRAKISGTASRPRLCVTKSNRYVFVQAIDDAARITIVSLHGKTVGNGKNNTVADCLEIGKKLGEQLVARGITAVVFDKGSSPYHGQVKAVAEGARGAGLQF